MPKEDENIRHTVSFNGDLDQLMTDRIRQGGFSSVSEYVRQAVREEIQRSERAKLDTLLLDRLRDPDFSPVTAEDTDRLRSRIEEAREAARKTR